MSLTSKKTIKMQDIINYMEKNYDYINGSEIVILYLKNKYGAKKALEIDLNEELNKIWDEITSYMDKILDYEILFKLEKLFIIREKIVFILAQYDKRFI